MRHMASGAVTRTRAFQPHAVRGACQAPLRPAGGTEKGARPRRSRGTPPDATNGYRQCRIRQGRQRRRSPRHRRRPRPRALHRADPQACQDRHARSRETPHACCPAPRSTSVPHAATCARRCRLPPPASAHPVAAPSARQAVRSARCAPAALCRCGPRAPEPRRADADRNQTAVGRGRSAGCG